MSELQRLRDEQLSAATLLLAGHPEKRGLIQAIEDNFAEELIILEGK